MTTTARQDTIWGALDGSGNVVIPAAEVQAVQGQPITLVIDQPLQHEPPNRSTRPVVVAAVVVVAFLVGTIAVLASHGRDWSWTGFGGGNTSLWSWLTILVQPLALAFLTVRLLSPDHAWRRWRIAGIAAAILFAVIIPAGYIGHWSWTGFRGQELWDWLHLLLLPVALVLLPEWVRKGQPITPRHRLLGAALLVAFALLVVGGYRWAWTWTGFTGNNFRDWLNLLIAPFLLPAACKIVHAHHTTRRSKRAALPIAVTSSTVDHRTAPPR